MRDHGYDTIEVDAAAEDKWTAMVDRGAAEAPFGESSYFFGTQHPGEAPQVPPQLGRPTEALQGDRHESSESDYKAFRLARSSDGGDRRQR